MGKWQLGFAVVALVLSAVVGGWRICSYEQDEALRRGIGALKEGDFAKARSLIAPMAREGHTQAQRSLGDMYAQGLGIEVDEVIAEIWFRRAECRCADPGQAEFDLGLDFLHEDPSKENEALTWIRRAAKAGHRRAQAFLVAPDVESRKLPSIDSSETRYWSEVIEATKLSEP